MDKKQLNTIPKEKPLMLANNQGHIDKSETANHYNPESTSTNNQRLKILQLLEKRPYSTLELRELGICSPASRILELRAKGYTITTSTTNTHNGSYLHKGIAVYTLHKGVE